MMSRKLFAAAAAVVAFSSPAFAQANLSTQGYGFPTGQFSSRTWGTGGSLAELDPLSPINPASVALHPTRIVTFQIEPEYRTVSTPNGTQRTTTARYPNVFGALPVGGNMVVSFGASTLLDRTSTTVFNTTQFLNAKDSVPMSTQYRIDGAMADVRLALGYNAKSWLRLGVGAHAITGHNLVAITQSFTDSAFTSFQQSLVLGFTGAAASAGAQIVGKSFSLGLSARAGGDLKVSVEDTTLARAKVPARFGATLAYTGIANSAIAIRTSKDNWSSLGDLGTNGLKGVDSWDSSIGADIAGPKMGNRILFLRGGFRTRTLPFQANGHDVTENSVTGGFGTTFANGRVLTDFATIYARRSADISANEHAWTLSIGIAVRP